jgi:Xaa-Pro dipeptidase
VTPAEGGPTADARAAGLRKLLLDEGLDALIATSEAGIAYLSGFHGLQLERLFAVVVRPEGGALVVPRLDEESARAAPTELERVVYDPTSDGLPALLGVLDGARRVGVEEAHLSFARARGLMDAGLELVAAGELTMRLRAPKDAEEVELITSACRLVEEALEEMFGRLRPGDVERVVNAEVEHHLRRAGATEVHPLILFGPNAARPHAEPGDRVLHPGDVVCADVSARLGGYWGDLTRCGTVGPASDWSRDAWGVVRDAQAAAIAAALAGAEARAVDAAQRRVIEAVPRLGSCLHGAGHAIGLEVHEPPFLVPASDARLAEGTVLTIEPGIYREGVGGIRLEDDVLVGEREPRVLSRLPLELREVPVEGTNA